MEKTRLLVFRFSSFGDVAMTVPVVKQVLEQNPQVEIVFVSNQNFEPLFQNIPRLNFYGVDLKKYSGLIGLYRLFKELKKLNPTIIIDLHTVIRTSILKLYFKISGLKTYSLDKGRQEKKQLTQKENKKLVFLKSMHHRYADVFLNAGFKINLPKTEIKIKPENKKIGIAPFARYQEKMYPIDKMKNIALELANSGKEIFLLGGGKNEIEELKSWEKLHSNINCISGGLSLNEELDFIKKLDLLISMDSANMHLASVFGVPCLSVWGATHPYAGFLGFNQSINNVVQSDLECRPCSIFGNKKCFRGDIKCMEIITEQEIINRIS